MEIFTPDKPILSEAVPERVMLPETMAPPTGDVMATAGGVMSEGGGGGGGGGAEVPPEYLIANLQLFPQESPERFKV